MPAWSFLYQYAVGGAFFGICCVLLVRARAIDLARPSGRRHLGLLLGGLVLYAAVHAFSVFVLPAT